MPFIFNPKSTEERILLRPRKRGIQKSFSECIRRTQSNELGGGVSLMKFKGKFGNLNFVSN